MQWLETLKTISQKYGLNEKQIETLGTETTLVLLGIIHLVEYEEILTNELELPRDSIERILTEIETSIIKNIRPQLVLAFEENKKLETEGNPENESDWKQNLDFILSGGDNSAFMTPVQESVPPLLDKEGVGGGKSLITTSPSGHSSFNKEERNASTPSRNRATPQEGNTTPPVNPPSLADIKSQLKV